MSHWQQLTGLGKSRSDGKGRPRNWVVLLVFLGTTLAVSATALISYQVVHALILAKLKQSALLSAQLKGNEIDRWLATHKARVEMLANTPTIRTMNWSAITPYLRSEQTRLQDFYYFSLSAPDGAYYTTRVGRTNTNPKVYQNLQRVMAGELFVADPLVSRSLGVVIVPIVAPIWSGFPGSGQPIGAIEGNINIDCVAQVVGDLKYGSGSYAFALNSEGKPIAHPNRAIGENGEASTTSFLLAKDPALQRIATQMVKKQRGIERVKINEKWVYVAYLPLRQADWSIALVIPRENIESQLGALNGLAVVLGGLLSIASMAAMRQLLLSKMLRDRADREALFNRMTGRIRDSLDIDRILQTTVEEVATLLNLERVAYVTVNSQQHKLTIQREYCREGLPEQLGCFELSPWGDLEEQLYQSETLLLTPAFPSLMESYCEQPAPLELKAHHYLALPVRGESEILGYLICIHATRWFWTLQERELLQAVADQLAIAIIQSLLYSQTQEQVKLLGDALRELKKTQAYLVHTEKMSSLGQMVGGLAHEINNPVNFIYGNLSHLNQYFEDLLDLVNLYKQKFPHCPQDISDFEADMDLDFLQLDLPRTLNSMKTGAERIRQIVVSLRSFSKHDESDIKVVDIHEGIDNTLLLLNSRLSPQTSVVKHYGNLPLVECYASQLNQVFINLLNNAIDALKSSTTPEKVITITTTESLNLGRHSIRISVRDNGPGIPPEIQPKIFDPFFTTKPVGSGRGLGLTISYQIVVDLHGGQISIHTPSEGGAEIVVEIPIVCKRSVCDRQPEVSLSYLEK
jgi:two-component system NtrC family sensor kinase